jgi:hypothetical protein
MLVLYCLRHGRRGPRELAKIYLHLSVGEPEASVATKTKEAERAASVATNKQGEKDN